MIDITTGSVLNDFSSVTIVAPANGVTTMVTLKLRNNSLYVGGTFQDQGNGNLIELNLSSGLITPLYYNGHISDFEIYNNKIYTTGGNQIGAPDQYTISELDLSGNFLWQKSISSNLGDMLKCLDVSNNFLYAGGIFSTFNGAAHRNIVKIDLSTHTATSFSLSPAPGPVGNTNCYSINDLIAFPGKTLMEFAKNTCSTPPNNISFYDENTGAFNNLNASIPYQGDYEHILKENDTSFWFSNNNGLKLYGITNYISSWSPNSGGAFIDRYYRKSNYLFVGGSFTSLEGSTHKGLGIYCLAPEKPKIQTSTATVCKKTFNVPYSINPDPWASSYVWSYSGAAIINGSGPSVSLDFPLTASSGTLSVYIISNCGSISPTLNIPVTVNGLPSTNVGPDIQFTCSRTTATLSAVPNSSSTHCLWTGPNSFSSTSFNNPIISSGVTGGKYVCNVTINATGCSRADSLLISFDTIRPAINHLTGNFLLTCSTNSLTLDASTNYPANDTLHWSGPLAFSQNNPATVFNPGTYFLSITSGTNGCKNKDSMLVTQNIILPPLSIAATQDTITCIKDSILLTAISTNTNTILYWKDSANDSLLNNSFVNQMGTYSANAIDTMNGCPAIQQLFTVSQNTTPPLVTILPMNTQLNCSYDSTTITASSPNTGATLTWNGPGSFSSGNPAHVGQQGVYVVTVTHPQNGCTAKDSVSILKQNVLSLTISSDTTICYGSSATIHADPIGGSPGFIYHWNNNDSMPQTMVNPNDTTKYVITITDSAGCIGKDSVTVNVPSPLSDSTSAFAPCDPNHPNGQIQVYANGGILPYSYSLNSSAFQPLSVFPNLSFGTYTISLTDSLGCLFTSSSTIDSSRLRPASDFILSTNEIKGDTFVLVDISNPRPDSVRWILPANCTVINSDPFAPEIINSDTGTIQITMLSWFGTCNMSLTKNIHVFEFDTLHASDHNANRIKSIILYPNPNTGNFTADITFYKVQTFAIFIFDALGNELLRLPFNNLDFISAPISIPNPSPGTYVLKVISEYDSKTKTIQVTR
ncbi:MAG: T9SS type A sorting domain-containing protein [Bacteroidia bacterium]